MNSNVIFLTIFKCFRAFASYTPEFIDEIPRPDPPRPLDEAEYKEIIKREK